MTEEKKLERRRATLYKSVMDETQRETMIRLVRQIDKLTQEQQSRLADIALGMALQKEIDVKKAS